MIVIIYDDIILNFNDPLLLDNQTRPDIIKIRNNLDHLGIFTNCIQAKIGYLIVYANNTIYHN